MIYDNFQGKSSSLEYNQTERNTHTWFGLTVYPVQYKIYAKQKYISIGSKYHIVRLSQPLCNTGSATWSQPSTSQSRSNRSQSRNLLHAILIWDLKDYIIRTLITKFPTILDFEPTHQSRGTWSRLGRTPDRQTTNHSVLQDQQSHVHLPQPSPSLVPISTFSS